MRTSPSVMLALAALALAPFATPSEPPKPTQGMLLIVDDEGSPVGLCPLKHTEVEVDIAGFIARVTLTQQFANPSEEPIEAVYVFPMSEKAAVDTMEMTVGDRTIRGVIKEREEARRIYEAARDAGKAAGLLDQERPNIFTQRVANIMPGNEIHITISYVEYLKYEEGEYAFSFPMVVGPRYIPGEPTAPDTRPGLRSGPEGTDQVPDSGRITPPITPEGTRAGHDISLSVQLNAGVPVQDIRSELHEVTVAQTAPALANIALKDQETIPNRDFVLRYAVAGEAISDAVLTHASAKGGFFTLILQPPDRVAPEEITPKEMLFVIDCSGSMRGFPIEKAKKTMRLCIEQMNPDDTFNLISFSGGTGYCFEGPQPNTDENRRKALEYLGKLEGGGGTEMMAAIHAALADQHDSQRLRVVCFMTDALIGNDMAILDAIQKNAAAARMFVFGIGNSVNRFLIEGMGRVGRGASEVVTLESDGDAAAKRFQERINDPLLTDITIDFGGLGVYDVYPAPEAIPDLFASTPLIVKGRYDKSGHGTVTVRGKTAQGAWERHIDVTLPAEEPEFDVLAPLWAREKVAELMNQDWLGMQRRQPDAEIKQAITQVGLAFSLVTQYTSFVAVEEKIINEKGELKMVEVPVEMPDGVSYEGVFGESAAAARMKMISAPASSFQDMSAGAPMSIRLERGGLAGRSSAGAIYPTQRQVRSLSDETVARVAADAAVNAKLDAALQSLARNPRAGTYKHDGVTVTRGRVAVVIELTAITDAHLQTLKELGVTITATARSGNRLMANVPVTALRELAQLEFIKTIRPQGS
jgi:Ca-activated chloride channel homolog